MLMYYHLYSFFFFFNDTATTEIYTLSLHDALPILRPRQPDGTAAIDVPPDAVRAPPSACAQDRKSTRLNSSHPSISYAVFCLKKKKKKKIYHSSSIKCKYLRSSTQPYANCPIVPPA